MTKEEVQAYFANLDRIADEIIELIRENKLNFSEANNVLERVKGDLTYRVNHTLI